MMMMMMMMMEFCNGTFFTLSSSVQLSERGKEKKKSSNDLQ